MSKTIGERLKYYREKKKLKVIDFSEMIGISQGTLSGLENNKSKPSTDTLASLVRHTDINIDWLLTGQKQNQGGPCDADPEIAELLEQARNVLKSGNPMAFQALAHNIKYFDHAVKVEKRLVEAEEAQRQSEKRHSQAEERQRELEAKLENIMALLMNQKPGQLDFKSSGPEEVAKKKDKR